MDILVTGASGYVGGSLARRLLADGHNVFGLARDARRALPMGVAPVYRDLAAGVPEGRYDLVIHCAGEVRPSRPKAPLRESVNCQLARNAAQIAASRLLVLSSVSASVAQSGRHVRRYGLEKLEAEKVVIENLPAGTPVVFLRPPAIYGRGAKGAFATLAALVAKHRPLPLKAATTPRPYLSMDNLADLVSRMAAAPIGVWTTAHKSTPEPHDGRLIGTADLCRMIGMHIGKPARLIYLPPVLLRLIGKATGKSELVSGALDAVPLKFDGAAIAHWGWTPARGTDESLDWL